MKKLSYLLTSVFLIFVSCSDNDPIEDLETDDVVIYCPDDNHPHVIDLGLPSGTKWSCCNVGASFPSDYGDYFAWGEVENKNSYNMNNYAYYNDSTEEFIFIGDNISGTDYDAACANWGESWNMPTRDQVNELIKKCTWTWTTMDGKKGYSGKGKNGKYIFLPASGWRGDNNVYRVGDSGCFWTSNPMDNAVCAYTLYYYMGLHDWSCYYKYYGRSVRPIKK